MARLVVHCGLHKTGSTAIQVALKRLVSSPKRAVPAERSLSPLERIEPLALATQGTLYVSDENLFGNAFSGYADFPEHLRRLSGVVYSHDYLAVVYVRHQLDWLESLYVQAIQEGGSESPESFVDKVMSSRWVDWIEMHAELMRVLGGKAICMRIYRPDADIVSDFCQIAGLKDSRGMRARRSRINRSMSPDQTIIMSKINSLGVLDRFQTQDLRQKLQREPGLLRASDWSVFPEDLQSKILCGYASSWSETTRLHFAASKAKELHHGRKFETSVRPYAGKSPYAKRWDDEQLARIAFEWTDAEREQSAKRGRWYATLRDLRPGTRRGS